MMCSILFMVFCTIISTCYSGLVVHNNPTENNITMAQTALGRSRMVGIIGGQEVTPYSYPYLVVLNLFSPYQGFLCGGTLITPRTVLTAAHCFDHKPNRVVVYLGRHDVSRKDSNVQQMTSRKFIKHNMWNRKTLQNDIALVILPKAATLNKYVQLVKIASMDNESFSGKVGSTLGWGLTETGRQSYQLRKVDTEILSNSVCSQSFSQIISSLICTSGSGVKGSCQGDSGGPLIVDGKQVGIVSYGSTNCTASLPSVFTRLTSFKEWLKKNVDDPSIIF